MSNGELADLIVRAILADMAERSGIPEWVDPLSGDSAQEYLENELAMVVYTLLDRYR
jgi:hypothetical protein